ncbi:response regulator [Candidatus Saccharibacteria bacterium]|nr:response regulator [Candidatus Saccharibacteria bacterium]
MPKIMVVEDDQSLREIYSIRLTAEGYEVCSAGDGEEALAIAVKERPDLVLSDVMMPKISGFDMLDILRSTPETKDIKVIMMTALSSDDQRRRGESLGADRYLVKSQVGIEDVIAAVHEVLGGAAAAPMPEVPIPPAVPVEQQMGVPTPVVAPDIAMPMPTAPVSVPASAPVQPTAIPQGVPNVQPQPIQPIQPTQQPIQQPTQQPTQPVVPVAPTNPAQ